MEDFQILLTEYWIYFIPVYFLLGISLGSFYFNLLYRISVYFYSQERKKYQGLSRWKRILFTPSHCENCEITISSIHLIPVLGYFFSKGECPHCGYKIPIIYPITEFLFGFIGISSLILSENPLLPLLFLLFCGHLLVSMGTDLRYFSLDYENLIWIVIWGLGVNFLMEGRFPGMEESLVFVGFFAFFLIIHLFYPNGLGMGDVLFFPTFAFLAGHPWWLFLLNASYISAVAFTVLFKKKRESLRETPIPMGVYFCVGIFLTFTARMVFSKYGIEFEYE